MHTEQDRATYYATMSKYTGHSARYLRVRAWVRGLVVGTPLVVPFVSILINK